MSLQRNKSFGIGRSLLHQVLVIVGAVALALAFFLVLPLMQTLNKPPTTDLTIQSIDTAKLEAPDPPPEPEPEEEQPEEEPPPELAETSQPLDITQLEMALNPSFGEGWLAGDFAVKLNTVVASSQGVEALFSVAELDQKPRIVYEPGPTITREVRKNAPGKVSVIFVVNENGRVVNPKVVASSNPVFVKPVLNAIKQWRFEPGKRGGKPVRFRMKRGFTFPKGL
jgi:protein TonB